MIKKFENFINTNDDIDVYTQVVGHKVRQMETKGFDMSYVESGCNKYIGEGFYEKALERSKYIYDIFVYLKPIMGLLNGFADIKFADIIKKDKDLDVELHSGISHKTKGYGKYNGFFYNRNLTIESIVCTIIYDFLSNTNLGNGSRKIRTTDEMIKVDDPKYNILNMPDNKDLYTNLGDETIKYIKNYDIDKEYVPSIRLNLGILDWESFRSVNINISECDDAFDEFLKVFNHLVKKNPVVVKEITNKYNPTTTEYRVLFIF